MVLSQVWCYCDLTGVCVCVRADNTHLPFGRPAVMFETQYSLLHHVEFISGYSKELAMPLWTAYTLPRQVHTHTRTPSVPSVDYHATHTKCGPLFLVFKKN